MNRSSEFIKNKALFGGYPTQEYVDLYENMGVRYFVDLTQNGEKRTIPYITQYTYINYPIQDFRIPSCWSSFAKLIIKLVNIIKNLPVNNMIYVHCRGGHGRAGVVVACILCYIYKISAADALALTTKYHGNRKEMRDKWRKLGSPQTRSQKHFVTKFFEPLYIYNNYSKYFTAGFNNNFSLSVNLSNIGIFPTATEAFKYLQSKEVNSMTTNMIRGCTGPVWETRDEELMYYILQQKFDQHSKIKKNLLCTGLRCIIVCSNNLYWGKKEKNGRNILGSMMGILREELYVKSS
jgi:hypothetical protein